MWDTNGKEYIDLIGGINVCNIGHRHPKVVEAIKNQADRYLHLMVYGELVEDPQVEYAHVLISHLPPQLNSVFFTASGSEATEGAMKLSKRFTGRSQIISFKNAYHGSTQGALSVMGSENWKQKYRPLLPDTMQISFNSFDDLEKITARTAAVIVETIQGEAGVIVPAEGWMQALREKCNVTGALLVLDEIQCAFGRNGTLWAFSQYGIVPDILLVGKALGGGMPLGAFISDKKIMACLTDSPVLGHMSTFGGHPVCCAAGLAAFKVLLDEKLIDSVNEKGELFCSLLKHPLIKNINHRGLMLAVELASADLNKILISELIEQGIFTDWFLFAPHSIRIVPPLNISTQDIETACNTILKVLNKHLQ